MAFVFYNPNPLGNNVPDCATRAVAKALDMSWDEAHIKIFLNSLNMGDTMDGNSVWGAVLKKYGFNRAVIPNTCPDCYTAEDFCKDHPVGTFVLGFGNHTATVVDGNIYDTADCSHMIPMYYWYEKEDIINEQPVSGPEQKSEPTTSAPTTK